MTAYVSDKSAANQPAITHGDYGTVKCAYAKITTTAALTTADTFKFFTLPKGARLIGAKVKFATAMDTNGSPTLTIDIGDAGSAARLFSAITTAQAGGVNSTIATGGQFFSYTSDTVITGACHANAATGVAGTIEFSAEYIVEGFAD